MSQAAGKIYIPPYSGVRLIECRDHFQLVPVPAVRPIYGYGKIKASKATVAPDDPICVRSARCSVQQRRPTFNFAFAEPAGSSALD
jgi:hypothetical protein